MLTLLLAQQIYVVGTVTLTQKKARVSKDFSYSKLSGAAMRLTLAAGFGGQPRQSVQADSLFRP